jgi:hypothetical protein
MSLFNAPLKLAHPYGGKCAKSVSLGSNSAKNFSSSFRRKPKGCLRLLDREMDVFSLLVDGYARFRDLLVVDGGEDEGDERRGIGAGRGGMFGEYRGVVGYACAV